MTETLATTEEEQVLPRSAASSLVSILPYFRRRGFNSSNGKSLQGAEIQNFPGLGGPQSAKASAQQL